MLFKWNTPQGFTFSTAEQEALLNAVGQAALVSLTDVKGNIIYVNRKFIEVSKYSEDELIGKNHRILKSGNQPDELFVQLWKTIVQGQVWRGDICNRAKDGSYYWVDTSIVPILNDHGAPERYLAVRFLITDKKRTEEELEQQRVALLNVMEDIEEQDHALQESIKEISKFRAAVEHSYESTVITDTHGNIQYVNPAFTHLTGYSREEAIGQNPRILQSGKTPRGVYDSMWSLIAKGGTFTSDELVNKRKDGTEYFADIAIYPVMDGDNPMFFVAVQRDVTQRKKEERAKAEFVSIASHQLRTPLTAIRWSLGRFRKKVSNLDTTSRELLDAAGSAAVRMSETINAMLNMSRLAAGKIRIEEDDIHLCDLLEAMREEVEPQYTEKGIHFHLECVDGWTIKSDPKLLKEIINNLLTNAVKYTPPQGDVSVRVRRDEREVIIEVQDTGYGIPKDQQSKIFSKFFRADNVLDKEPDGNGLGLYLVRELTIMLGGTIRFDSEICKGTTFTVTLPFAPTHT